MIERKLALAECCTSENNAATKCYMSWNVSGRLLNLHGRVSKKLSVKFSCCISKMKVLEAPDCGTVRGQRFLTVYDWETIWNLQNVAHLKFNRVDYRWSPWELNDRSSWSKTGKYPFGRLYWYWQWSTSMNFSNNLWLEVWTLQDIAYLRRAWVDYLKDLGLEVHSILRSVNSLTHYPDMELWEHKLSTRWFINLARSER